MERVSTGIKELDGKIEEGYPRNRTTLLSGTTGSGKTILGLHFIYNGCSDGKKCAMIATEETPEDLLSQAESIGLPLSKYYKNGVLAIERVYDERAEYIKDVLAFDITNIDELQSNIIGLLDRIPKDTEIVLIDNIGVFTLNMSTNEFRAQFDALIHGLAKKNVTSVIILDSASDERTGGIAAYSVYGVIKTLIKENPYTGSKERLIEILKMRNTKTQLDPIRFEVTSNGIVLLKK
ncbi:MAG: ATPase domain-containing protein [Candidatus Methanoperedens sp.]|nr:ATPase domain-containing protein [Candidatus Methanoperedens sp.]